MKKTIISGIISLICTAAICITAIVCVNKFKTNEVSTEVEGNSYLTEAEAADYLGLDESRLVILRKDLKYLEGSYITYSFVNSKKEEVSVVMYSKDGLDKAITKLMSDSKTNSINFKYLEEALAQQKNSK